MKCLAVWKHDYHRAEFTAHYIGCEICGSRSTAYRERDKAGRIVGVRLRPTCTCGFDYAFADLGINSDLYKDVEVPDGP